MITAEIKQIINRAIKEDHIHQDITTNLLVPKNQMSEAHIIAKEPSVLCGTEIAAAIFHRLDPNLHLRFFHTDGECLKTNTRVVYLKGKTRALLSGERVALNFLSYLSGIATITHKYVRHVHPLKVKIMDTRKTLPGLRVLVKMAVRAGGGVNHRFNLKEMVMIKDNHQIAYPRENSIKHAIQRIRSKTDHLIVVEVDDLLQFHQALEADPDIILLDNMRANQIQKAVKLNQERGKKCLLEASGGVNLANIRSIAKTGVDRISIGAITHSSKAMDFSMEFIK
jgi:nicotinate-nucleotide pyrophosphorylase (carboxylating)